MNKSPPSVAGVDGCRGGWLAVEQDFHGSLTAFVCPTAEELMQRLERAAWIGIDIPIGLPDAGCRACDVETRGFLGQPRGSSVFPAPLRACLGAQDYSGACEARFRIEGKKISRQTYNLIGKIREIDTLLRGNLAARRRVIEVHPELSFAQWNLGLAMVHNKKKSDGRHERRKLIESKWPQSLENLRFALRDEKYATDDLHDALAVLWSVCRWSKGEALQLGNPSVQDAKGLPMRIVA